MGEPDPIRKAGRDLEFRARQILMRELWGQFPLAMRPFFIAQRKLCPYCRHLLVLDRATGNSMPSTWDHVVPRSLGGGGHQDRNKVLAHAGCNRRKGDRAPHPCERLFCQITNEIVFSLARAL